MPPHNYGQPPPWYIQQQQQQQQAAAAQGYYPSIVPPNAYPAYPRQPPYYYPNQAQQPVQPPVQPSWNAGAYVAAERPYRGDIRSKYPRLTPVLASDVTVLSVDVSKKPIQCILMQTYYAYRLVPAILTDGPNPVTNLRLYCKSFPWSIDIVSKQVAVACGVVWDAIYGCLQEPLADSEWALICADRKLKEKAEKAMRKRLEADPLATDRRMKRIDFLGEEKYFRGLEKDEEFQKARTLPGSSPPEGEVWVIKMTGP